jgi:hypothetical protein
MSRIIDEEIRRIRHLTEHNAGRNCAECGEDASVYLATPTTSTLFLCEDHYGAVTANTNGEVGGEQ